jgi:hypothetical protein
VAYSWIAINAVSGSVLADLPDFTIDSASVLLGQSQTASGTYPLVSASTPADWLLGTVPWSVAILLLDSSAPNPVAGWYINQRVRTAGDAMTVPLVTPEAYFDRRYVGNATFAATDQNTILTSLVASFVAAAPAGSTGLVGLPISSVVVGGAGAVRDRTYLDVNDQTVMTAATELMGVSGGPEWTVTWQHLSSPERYFPVFNVGTRIGSVPSAGLGPSVTFEMGGTSGGGSVHEVTYTEDWSAGKGANFVTATGTTDAMNNRPQQSQSAADVLRPALEYRWNPSTSITDTATLLAHAISQLALMRGGARALALSSDATSGPLLGVDWFLGDTVGYSIGGQDQFGNETVPAFPGGLTGSARVVGWSIDPDSMTPTVTPILGSI